MNDASRRECADIWFDDRVGRTVSCGGGYGLDPRLG